MINKMYKSNRLIFFFQKYGFLIFSLIWIVAYFHLSLTHDAEISINGIIQQADYLNSLPFLLFGILFSTPYFLYGRKMVYVEMDNETIWIRKNRKRKEYSWHQVDRLGLSYIILPPTYRLKIKNDSETYFFCSGMHGFAVPFRVWDFSKMGGFIKEKKKQCKLEY